ncbi:hypothetical protein WR25_13788 [Diploscapter pachys]|uniref:GOST seven transmembrane domain-containing protein n=1 Tax=Diploscapter pachys TaxID=2018661 RepID=A0A2A2JHY1_9BILA|nr:hypothetical protein WR25_13788 [Diploscapter pachys]
MKRRWTVCAASACLWLSLSLLLCPAPSQANLLMPGIYTETLVLKPNVYELMGVPQSCRAGTEVQISMQCQDLIDFEFDMQYVLRSSPCDKEFFNSRKTEKEHTLPFYFDKEYSIPDDYDYPTIAFYKSQQKRFKCKEYNGKFFFTEEGDHPMQMHNVTPVDPGRSKRAAEKFAGVNDGTADGGTKLTLSTFHPAQKVPIDGIYFLVIKVNTVSFPASSDISNGVNITLTVEWRSKDGYLSAIDYPLLRFYVLMCVFYAILAITWLYLCIKYYTEILRIQYWIGGVIILGMIEKAFFLSEYSTMNATGKSVEGVLELAEMVSCAKKTMSRVLVIIVSVGYGIVKPRLGNTFSQVAGVGLVYFVFCSIEGIARVSKNTVEAAKQKQFAALPLIITEMVIFYWIYTSLATTMRTLRLRRNEVGPLFRSDASLSCLSEKLRNAKEEHNSFYIP